MVTDQLVLASSGNQQKSPQAAITILEPPDYLGTYRRVGT